MGRPDAGRHRHDFGFGNRTRANGVLTFNEPDSSLDRFMRYRVVGSINTVIELSLCVFVTMALKVPAAPANIVSYTVALCASFVLNRNFTFGSSKYSLTPAMQFYRFVAVNLVSLVGSTAAIWLLST